MACENNPHNINLDSDLADLKRTVLDALQCCNSVKLEIEQNYMGLEEVPTQRLVLTVESFVRLSEARSKELKAEH